MSWTTALSDLRLLISDAETDRLRWRKPLLGVKDGTNTLFKTFEKRRLTTFVTAQEGDPVGVYVNDDFAEVTDEDLASGSLILATAPGNNDRVTATYYAQRWLDSQLTQYLKNGTQFLGLGSDPTVIPDGLQPAALKYAAADAYQELSVRYAEMVSEQFRLEDSPKDILKATIEGWLKLASTYRKEAEDLRKGYYTRQNESDSPIFDSIVGHVRNTAPNR